MDNLLAAVYEAKRQSFLAGFVGNPEFFDASLAYAYLHRMAPFFHETDVKESYGEDVFDDVYAIKSSFVDGLTKYMDECWRRGDLNALAFSNLEDLFGGYRTNRSEIICVLEYAKINGRFDENVWAAVEQGAPVEALGLKSTFCPEDVFFD